MLLVKSQSFLSFFLLIALILTIAVPRVKAWTEADFEIFDIVDALEKAEGKDANFYSWLGIPLSANQADISKAYRKLSLKWHPDKNSGDEKAKDRFTRLGVIVSILRDPTSRERYNFFYKNGVPRWRGTGYLYSRFRPGVGTVIAVLSLIAASMQYIAQHINYRQEKRKIVQFVADARVQMIQHAAKGCVPTLGRSYIEVGQRNMRCDVKGDNYLVVYPDEKGGEPVHLNTEWVQQPSIKSLFIFEWPRRLINSILNKKDNKEDNEATEQGTVEEEETEAISGSDNQKKKLRKRGEKMNVMGTKVGGRRKPGKRS